MGYWLNMLTHLQDKFLTLPNLHFITAHSSLRTKQPIKQPFNDIHENSGDSQVLSRDFAVTIFAWLLMRFMFDKPPKMPVNDIHSPMMVFMMHLTRVTFTERFDKGLRLNSSLAGQLLLNFSLQISTLLPTLNHCTNVKCYPLF